MQRLRKTELLEWKNSPERKPLLLQGIRQCGKTWLLQEFGKEEFADTAYFNFEHTGYLTQIFEADFDVNRILTELGIYRQKKITPAETLLILDEIQICPRAVTSLKYFAELMPQLHVAAAGSLLGVAVAQMGKNTSFPVGKVRVLTLLPLSFREYLMANGEDLLCEHIQTLTPEKQLPDIFCEKLETLYTQYLITGGMPEIVNTWITTHDIRKIEKLQEELLADYEKDFIKYATPAEFPKLVLIWKGIPLQLAKDNQKFIFSQIKSGMRARDLEDSLQWLISAGLVHKVIKIERPEIPLATYQDMSNFKMYFCDVGLLRKMSGYPADAVLDTSQQTAGIRGILAENFVLTELISAGITPCFWKSGGTAEIDFIIQDGLNVIPIEVKSGKNTRAKSLIEYRKKYAPAIAVRTSLQKPASHTDDFGTTLEIPPYLLWNLNAYLNSIRKQR